MAEQTNSLRDELFPDGIPEPEAFIRRIAEYIIEQNNSSESCE